MEIRHVKFYNHKLAISFWDDNNEIWVEKDLSELDISLPYLLRTPVYFDSKLTVYGFMMQLHPYYKEIDELFEGSSMGYSLKDFYKNLREEVKKDDILDYAYLEFYRAVEIWEDDISDYCSFHAKSKNDDLTYSLAFSPIKNWKHLLFKLNTEYAIYDYTKKESICSPIFTANKDYTLYELLDGFIYELTFHGSLEEQIEKGEEVMETFNKIEKGEVKTCSLDELILENLEEELENLIKQENYEEAEKVKQEIKELKIKIQNNKE